MATVAAKGDVKIKIGTGYDDQGVVAGKQDLEAIGKGSSTVAQKMAAQWENVKKNWLAAAAALFAIKQAWDIANAAAKFDQQAQAFTNLAASHGVNAKQIIANLKEMSAGTVSTAGLMESAGAAMLLGIPAERLSEMMEIARASAKVMGTTTEQAFNDIAKGIGRQSPLILDNLGITVKLEKAYSAYAKAQKTTVAAMTDAEKKQAFLNAVMTSGQEIVKRVGTQTLTAADAMAIFSAKLEDGKIILGKILISISAFLSAVALGFSTVFSGVVGIVARSLSELVKLGEGLPFVGDRFKAVGNAIRDFSDFELEAAKKAAEMSAAATDVGLAVWKEKEAVEGLVVSREEMNKVDELSIEKKQKMIEETENFLNQIQGMAEKSLLSEEEIEHLRHDRLMEQLQTRLLALQEANLLEDEQAFEFMIAREQAETIHQQKLTAIRAKEAKKQADTEKKKELLIFNMKMQIGRQVVGLFRSIGGEHKAFALAAIALETVLNIIQAKQNTAVAVTRALAMDPTGVLAARVAALGAIQIGLIGASGAIQAVGALGGGGAEAGSPGGEPLRTQETNVFNVPAEAQQPQIIERTVINIEGNVVDLATFARDLIPFTEEAEGDKVS